MTDSETIFCRVMHWTIVVANIVLFHIETLKNFETVTVSISKNKYKQTPKKKYTTLPRKLVSQKEKIEVKRT